MAGFIYVMSNPSFPHLFKIGKSSKDPAQCRADELYTTGVPTPFKVEYSVLVGDEHKVERLLHSKYKEKRHQKNREFFEIDLHQACKEITQLLEERLYLKAVLKEPIIEVIQQPQVVNEPIAKKESVENQVESRRQEIREKYIKDQNHKEKMIRFGIEYETKKRERESYFSDLMRSYRQSFKGIFLTLLPAFIILILLFTFGGM
jgi:hypothetical protein